jgi:RNA polymerase sigma factor (sigma-70 family)
LRGERLYEDMGVVASDDAAAAGRDPAAGPDDATTVVALDAESRRLFQVAYHHSGDRGEDAVAEAVARVWRRGLSKPVEDIRPYLRRTLVYLLGREHHRRTSEATALARHGAPGEVPELSAEVVEHLTVEAALLLLPTDQRVVVVLRYFEGMSEAEIASTLRIARGTVKSRSARALAALRPLLEGRVK